MSLRTGTQLITLAFLINKLTGLYGLLAIATGYSISPVQLSMYIYSLVALALGANLAPHIRRGAHSPLQNLALAWLYLLDSAVNLFYTIAFGLTWFLVLAKNTQNPPSSGDASNGKASPGAGGNMMDDTAGFTNPSYTVSAVHVVVTSTAASGTQKAALVGKEGSASQTSDKARSGVTMTGGGALTSAILSRESMSSLATITALWLLRVYAILVVLAYARSVLRQHVVIQSQTVGGLGEFTPIDKDNSSAHAFIADNPFARGTPEGTGWRGALGRAMLGCGKNYWLGMEDASDTHSTDEEWARSLGERFQGRTRHRRGGTRSSAGTSIGSYQEAQAGPGERERRRRAGTGPPPPQPPSGLGLNTNIPVEGRSGSVPRVRPIELGKMVR